MRTGEGARAWTDGKSMDLESADLDLNVHSSQCVKTLKHTHRLCHSPRSSRTEITQMHLRTRTGAKLDVKQ